MQHHLNSSHFFLTLAAFFVMNGDDATAFGTGVFFFLFLHECLQAMLPNKLAIFHKSCLIPCVITFFKIFYQLARIVRAFKTIRQSFIIDTIFYFALTTMFRLFSVTIQTTATRLSVITVLVADFTVHSTRSKHDCLDVSFRHLH